MSGSPSVFLLQWSAFQEMHIRKESILFGIQTRNFHRIYVFYSCWLSKEKCHKHLHFDFRRLKSDIFYGLALIVVTKNKWKGLLQFWNTFYGKLEADNHNPSNPVTKKEAISATKAIDLIPVWWIILHSQQACYLCSKIREICCIQNHHRSSEQKQVANLSNKVSWNRENTMKCFPKETKE